METISEDFLEIYLKPQTGVPWVESLTRILQLSKEFRQTLPLTHKAYFAKLLAVAEQNQLLYQLAFELGGTMFDIYRRFYEGFSQPEQEGNWEKNSRKIRQLLQPQSGMSEENAVENIRGFVQQDSLMALFMLKVEAFVFKYPETKPLRAAVFANLAVLAAQLNELVGLMKEK